MRTRTRIIGASVSLALVFAGLAGIAWGSKSISETPASSIDACYDQIDAFFGAVDDHATASLNHEPFLNVYLDVIEERGTGPILVDDPITLAAMDHMLESSKIALSYAAVIRSATKALDCMMEKHGR